MDVISDKGKEEVISLESSEDEILKKLPTPKRQQGRRNVNFLADLNLDDDDEDMEETKNDQNADENVQILEIPGNQTDNENSNSAIQSEKKEDSLDKSNKESFWTEDEMKLAVALWNDLEPHQIHHIKGRWYHMYSSHTAPLRDPSH